MRAKPKYIIVTPDYDDTSGGRIALHKLCHELNQLGATAVIWPDKWVQRKKAYSLLKQFRLNVKDAVRGVPFYRHPDLNTPLAKLWGVGARDIVVYPEVVAGNPLGNRNVVRWLLHRPGFHTGIVDYNDGDLFFKYADFADDPVVTGGKAERLFVFSVNDVYRNHGLAERKGACYLVRKGEGVEIDARLAGATKIDGLPHPEVAEIFNRCEVFYSFDDASMYSCYAAMCGCTSVVLPKHYASREEWVAKNPALQLGVAYGEEDVAHARATQDRVRGHLNAMENESLASVKRFVELTQRYFA